MEKTIADQTTEKISLPRILKAGMRTLCARLSTLRGNEGFTMLEIMIVITIIGIMSVVIVPRLMDMPQRARASKAQEMISSLELALDRYNLDNGNYPTSEQGLAALISEPSTEPLPTNYNPGGYLKKKDLPKDPWGREFIYAVPGTDGKEYDLISLGADGEEGGDKFNADIRNQ